MVNFAGIEKFFVELPGEEIIVSDDVIGELTKLVSADPADTVVFSGTHYAEFFRCAGFKVWVGVEAEPSTGTVLKMADFLRENSPKQVAAVGGGSVLDAAKAAYLAVQTGWELKELFGVNKWSSANPGQTLDRIIAIPTTSGTGSEATPYSNIVDHELGVKKLIVEKESIPRFAICPVAWQISMPEKLTRATGCDALAHLLEGFLNVGADSNHPDANSWAKSGIALVKEFLLRAIASPEDTAARKGMMFASTLGGMTIRYKSTGVPHLCSFSWFGRIAHGEAVALLLPAAWRYYLANPAVAARTMELADIFSGDTPEAVVDSYEEFIRSTGLPVRLSAWKGITPELLEKTAGCGRENRMKLENAPRPIPLEKSYEILLDIMKKSY